MNREELIGLRKQVLKVLNEGRGLPLDVLAEQIVDVFEQAHTPTDDEREVTEDALWDVVERLSLPLTGVEVQALAESVARRTVQGEPTDAQVRAASGQFERYTYNARRDSTAQFWKGGRRAPTDDHAVRRVLAGAWRPQGGAGCAGSTVA